MMDEQKICQQFDRVVAALPAEQHVAFNHFWQGFLDAHLANLMQKYDCTDVYELATHHPEVYRRWIAQFKMVLYRHGVNEEYRSRLAYDDQGNLRIEKDRGRVLTIPIGA